MLLNTYFSTRTKVAALISLPLSFLFASLSFAETGASCISMKATGNSEYPPFLWRADQKSNILLGANQYIFDELSYRLGIKIDLMHTGPWSRAQLEVKSGRVDLMAGAFYTNERTEYMDYLPPAFLYTTSVIWQRTAQNMNFHQKEDLIGMRGVTVINNSFGQTFDDFSARELNVLSVASLSQAFKMLSAKRVDYAVYEKAPGMAYLDLLGMEGEVEPISPPISSEGLFLTLSKKSPCNTPAMKQKIAAILKSMKDEGFNERALEKGIEQWQKFVSATGH